MLKKVWDEANAIKTKKEQQKNELMEEIAKAKLEAAVGSIKRIKILTRNNIDMRFYI